mgnify:FL=1
MPEKIIAECQQFFDLQAMVDEHIVLIKQLQDNVLFILEALEVNGIIKVKRELSKGEGYVN